MTYINRVNAASAALSKTLDTATDMEIGDSETLALMIGAMIARAERRNDDNMVNALSAAHAQYLDMQYPLSRKS